MKFLSNYKTDNIPFTYYQYPHISIPLKKTKEELDAIYTHTHTTYRLQITI